jgi:dolichol-phosphate mannosyltransferase
LDGTELAPARPEPVRGPVSQPDSADVAGASRPGPRARFRAAGRGVQRLRGRWPLPAARDPRAPGTSGLAGQVRRLARFLGVGISGVLVNTAVLWFLTLPWPHVPYLLASAVATQVAIVWNFTWLDRLVFRRERHRSFPAGLARFWLLNVALVPVQLGLLALLVEVGSVRPVPANLVVLAAVFLARYSATLYWVYGRAGHPAALTRAGRAAASCLRGDPGATRGSARYLLRLTSPALLAVVAFPDVVLRAVAAGLSGSGLGSAAAAGTAGFALVAARAGPAPGEPDVHDRQLDVILAVPLLCAAAWLALGWHDAPVAAQSLGNRDVVALTAFTAGASLLLLGTRLTGRIWWALCLPLLGTPWLAGRPGLRTALIALAVTGAGLAVHRCARRAAGPAQRPQGVPGRLQPLPRIGVAAACVAVLALALGGSCVAAGDAGWPTATSRGMHTPRHR